VERLYSGLSDFSLTVYLILLTGLYSLRGPDSTVTVPRPTMVKLCKIICSLIFNKDSVTDWGRDIVVLAVKLSLEQEDVFQWISNSLETKPVSILLWYLKLCLTLSAGEQGRRFLQAEDTKGGVYKIYSHLEGKVSEQDNAELRYRLSFVYGS